MGKSKGRGKKVKGKKKKKSKRRDALTSSRRNVASSQLLHEDEEATVSFLVRKGRINVADSDGRTPLMWACCCIDEPNIEMVNLLLEHKASIDAADNDGFTPLYQACENDHAAVVRLLIERKASLDKAANDGDTPLTVACLKTHVGLAVVGLLIERKAFLDNATIEGVTPLFFACEYDHASKAGLLIEHKADIDKAANDGCTPLFVACQNGHAAVTRLLVDHKASLDKAANDGATPLYVACQNGHASVTRLLIEHKADVNKISFKEQTPLHVAIIDKNLECVKMLLREGGARFDLPRNDDSENILYDLTDPYISDANIAAFVRDTHGFSSLHFACEQRRPALLRALLRSTRGTDPSILLGRGPATDRALEEEAIKEEMRATRTCRVQVRTHGTGWMYTDAPAEGNGTWYAALDDGEDVEVTEAEVTRVAVPSLLEVSNDPRFGRVCARTCAIARRATLHWSPSSHHLFPVRFRRAAVAMLHARHALNTRERVGADALMAVVPRDIPLLGVWFVVLSMCPRNWFEETTASSGADVDSAEAEQQQWCEWCGRPRTLSWRPIRCSGCKQVYYCDVGCSRAGWSEHKAFCNAQKAL